MAPAGRPESVTVTSSSNGYSVVTLMLTPPARRAETGPSVETATPPSGEACSMCAMKRGQPWLKFAVQQK